MTSIIPFNTKRATPVALCNIALAALGTYFLLRFWYYSEDELSDTAFKAICILLLLLNILFYYLLPSALFNKAKWAKRDLIEKTVLIVYFICQTLVIFTNNLALISIATGLW